MHIHLSALEGFKVFLYVIVFGFFYRTMASYLHDTPIGKGMAFIY
jgi:hypothetical protein